MGVVYRGHDLKLGRDVALKTIQAGLVSNAGTERFEREARVLGLLGELNSKELCGVLHVFEHDEAMWIVMPYVAGETLAERIDHARHHDLGPAGLKLVSPNSDASMTPSRVVLSLISRIARAIHEAHERGVVHRDLKPSNIMISPDGDPIVLDFGIALIVDEDDLPKLTKTGERIGTPAYRSPERIDHGLGDAARTVDVYSLGVMAYELLTLKRPSAENHRRTSSTVIRAVRASEAGRDLPPSLDIVFRRTLAVDPAMRYPSTKELADDIDRVLASEAVHYPTGYRRRRLRRVRRDPRIQVAAAVGLVLLTVVIYAAVTRVRLDDTEKTAAAVIGFQKAVHHGQPPREDHVAYLAPFFESETKQRRFRENPSDENLVRELLDRLANRYRGPGETKDRILAPHGTITSTRPSFRFTIPSVDETGWELEVDIRDALDSTRRKWRVEIPDDSDGESVSHLPDDMELRVGRTYIWDVSDPSGGLYDAEPARFTIESPDVIDAMRVKFPVDSTDESRLARAGALAARSMFEAASRELDGLESVEADLLRASVAAACRDVEAFDRIREKLTGSASSTKRR